MNGQKNSPTLDAKIIFKGFEAMPDQVPPEKFPYVTLDDGGERVEDVADSTQNRFFSVIIEMGVFVYDVKKSLDDILDLSDQVKTIIELESSRQKDGHIWGINIVPFQGELSNEKFFRGRTVTVDFWELEDRTYQLH